jgi:LPS export ABC transporter permease LptF/LPS export ABC transporter permease LptG
VAGIARERETRGRRGIALNPTDARPTHSRSSAMLSRYLIAEMVLPSLYAMAAFGLVVLLTDLLGYAELIVNRGLSTSEVVQIAGLQLIPTLGRTLPFAVLVGSLVGLGRLSADRELLALEASGFSARQLARPGLLFAFAASLISVMVSVSVSPAAQRGVRDQMIRLATEKPGLALRPGLTTSLAGWRIQARDVEDGGAQLSGVLLYMPSLNETVFSQRGAILTSDAGAKRIVLEDGMIFSNDVDRASLLRFEHMETELPEFEAEKDVPVDLLSTLPFAQLIRAAQADMGTQAGRLYRIEAHRRVALGAAALPFGLLAMGLAFQRRRLSRSGGTVMGIVGAIAYYALVQLSEGMLRSENAPIGPVVWLPNLVFTTIAIILIFRAGRHAPESDRGGAHSTSDLLERARLRRPGLRMKRAALPRYVGAQFIRMVVLCVLGLTLAYLIIDVFDNLKWFNRYGATASEIGRYYGARLPVLIARVVPMALLISVALTISLLGENGELLGMRTCGIPVFRVLAPVWLLCVIAVPLDHLLTNEIVPRSSERATHLKRTEIKNQNQTPRSSAERVWYRVGKRIHEMERLDLLRGRASAVTLYDLGQDGLPEKRTDADGARHVGGGLWLLDNPMSVELFDEWRMNRNPDEDRLVEFGEETPSEIGTAHLTPDALRAALEDADLEGPIATAYRTDLQVKIAAPLACLLLPLIALFFSATGPPFPRPVHTLIASAIIAVTYALATSFAGSMGYGGSLSPLVAGWGPHFLFGMVALGMGLRLQRRLSRAG